MNAQTACTALQQIEGLTRDACGPGKPLDMRTIAEINTLALDGLKACNAHNDLVSALLKIADGNVPPAHIAYLTKAAMVEIARAALAKAGAA